MKDEPRGVLVLGGDGRYAHAVRALRRQGLTVETWGVPEMPDSVPDPREAMGRADLLLLPLRAFSGERIPLGDRSLEGALLPEWMKQGACVAAGGFPPELENWYREQGLRCVSLLELEPFRMSSAAATADGAICLAMAHMGRTLDGAGVLVVGWGRIGRQLAWRLKALGAHVTIASRQEQWEPEHLGYQTDVTGRYGRGLDGYDLIVNTAPFPVMTPEQGAEIQKDCLCLDLASAPGGFPPELPGVVTAPGLPAKLFPRTAGEDLARALIWAAWGEGRELE